MISCLICFLIVLGVSIYMWFTTVKSQRGETLLLTLFFCVTISIFFILFSGSAFAQPAFDEKYLIYSSEDVSFFKEGNEVKDISTGSMNVVVDSKEKEAYVRKTVYDKLYWLKKDSYTLIIPAEDTIQLK